MGNDLTVFCPFTRVWAVAPFFEALRASDVPFERARFIAYIDTDDPGMEEAIRAECERLPFAAIDVVTSGRTAPQDRHPRPRRVRHALMREASKTLVGDGALLLLEDDTLIPSDTFLRLLETRRDCDWAIGAEVGRWSWARPPGVWRILEQGGRLIQKEAVMPGPRPELVDATGFYCVLTTAAIYRELDCSTWSDMIGLDVHATWRLTQSGRRLMVDWRVPCIHITPTERLTMADARPLQASLVGCEDQQLQSI